MKRTVTKVKNTYNANKLEEALDPQYISCDTTHAVTPCRQHYMQFLQFQQLKAVLEQTNSAKVIESIKQPFDLELQSLSPTFDCRIEILGNR